MLYRLQEGELTLDGVWQDQSIQVLVPREGAAKGANLVVARDVLPAGMTLPDYIEQQKATFQRELTGYEPAQDKAGEIDGRPAHYLEFGWLSDGKKLRQMLTVIHGEAGLLNLTATVPGEMDEATRALLLAAMSRFRFARTAAADDGRS